jgi:hypothetical protein
VLVAEEDDEVVEPCAANPVDLFARQLDRQVDARDDRANSSAQLLHLDRHSSPIHVSPTAPRLLNARARLVGNRVQTPTISTTEQVLAWGNEEELPEEDFTEESFVDYLTKAARSHKSTLEDGVTEMLGEVPDLIDPMERHTAAQAAKVALAELERQRWRE